MSIPIKPGTESSEHWRTLTAIAASSQTFTSGTRLTCWGRDIT